MSLDSKPTQTISILIKVISVIMIGVFFLGSCSSSTMILSEQRDARVYIDGEYVGVTPYKISNSSPVGSCVSVKLTKKGYKDTNTSICKTEELHVGALVAGLFFVLPLLWVMGYKDIHNYDLERDMRQEEEERRYEERRYEEREDTVDPNQF